MPKQMVSMPSTKASVTESVEKTIEPNAATKNIYTRNLSGSPSNFAAKGERVIKNK